MKASEIAELVSGKLIGDNAEITGVASLESASPDDLGFAVGSQAFPTEAGCVIVAENQTEILFASMIAVRDPKLAFALAAEALHPQQKHEPEVHPTAVVADSADLALDVFVGAFACIGHRSTVREGTQLLAGVKLGDDVSVGRNCVLHPNVVVENGCTIGNNVVLHSGAVIGADGFGFVRGPERYVKFPQMGTVVIEDDVEIGANTCIDRGALGETRIGEGTKIDNMVQVAHNVRIGKRVVIAAQTGISGSTIIEDDCVIGGQVGFGDHARVQSGAVIGSQAGVLPGKIVRPGVWWGTPVQPLDEYKKQNARLKGISRLKNELDDIKRRIGLIEESD
jgi:UDP-3-O-[3-hydroxymyristoyl] glucosamine N-acyltransferase